MGAKNLKQEQCDWETDSERFDPDYYPRTKKSKTKRGNTVHLKRLKSKASDSSKKSGSNGRKWNKPRKWTKHKDLYDVILAQFSVLVEAERILANLQNDIPRFVKLMLPSNVVGGFWMHIPRLFCKLYLPNHDSTIVLVDESGKEHETIFKLTNYGLSGGWRTFSFLHEIKSGEIVIFKLVAPCKIKVHIVRVPDSNEINAVTQLIKMSGSSMQPETDFKNQIASKSRMLKYVPFPLDNSSPLKNRRKCTEPGCRLCDSINLLPPMMPLEKSSDIKDGPQLNDPSGPPVAILPFCR